MGLIGRWRSWLDVPIAAAVGFWVFFWGNGSLYLSQTDATYWAIRNEESFRNGWLGASLYRSLEKGLGVWTDPHALVLDLPVIAALMPSGRFNEVVFGGASVLAAYVGAKYLAESFDLDRFTSRLAGVIFAFAVILPSPFMWARTPLYMRSMPFLLCLTSLVVGSLIRAMFHDMRATSERSGSRTLTWALFSMGAVALLFVGGLSTIIPILIPTAVFTTLLIFGRPRGSEIPRALAMLALTVVVCVPMAYGLARFYGQSGMGGSNWISHAVLVAPDRSIGPDGLFQDLGFVFPRYRVFMIVAWMIAIGWCFYRGGRLRTLGIAGATAFLGASVYYLIYLSLASRGTEVGPSSAYVVVGAYPFLAIVVAVYVQASLVWILDRAGSWSPSAHVRRLLPIVPVVSLLLWSTLWSVDNRHMRRWTPTLPLAGQVDLESAFGDLDLDRSSSFRGRTLLVTPGQAEQGGARSVVAPGPLQESLHHLSRYSRIPFLGTYSHGQSAEFVAFMSRFFADGSPFVRNWTIATTVDPRIAGLAGVRTLLFEDETNAIIAGAQPVQRFEILGNALGRVDLDQVNLGQYSPTVTTVAEGLDAAFDVIAESTFDPRRDVVVESDLGVRLLPATGAVLSLERDELVVKARSSGTSLLVLPFEFSACARPVGATGVRLLRVNGLFLGVLFTESLDTRITFRTSVFRASCLTK